MNLQVLSKFIFKIRTKSGVVVDNLQISATTLEAAERNLRQMYVKCHIISVSNTETSLSNMPNFEDVLNLIVNY